MSSGKVIDFPSKGPTTCPFCLLLDAGLSSDHKLEACTVRGSMQRLVGVILKDPTCAQKLEDWIAKTK